MHYKNKRIYTYNFKYVSYVYDNLFASNRMCCTKYDYHLWYTIISLNHIIHSSSLSPFWVLLLLLCTVVVATRTLCCSCKWNCLFFIHSRLCVVFFLLLRVYRFSIMDTMVLKLKVFKKTFKIPVNCFVSRCLNI